MELIPATFRFRDSVVNLGGWQHSSQLPALVALAQIAISFENQFPNTIPCGTRASFMLLPRSRSGFQPTASPACLPQ